MDEKTRTEDQEVLREDANAPKPEERCKLAKEDVDNVAGGRPPVHTPPQ